MSDPHELVSITLHPSEARELVADFDARRRRLTRGTPGHAAADAMYEALVAGIAIDRRRGIVPAYDQAPELP